MADVVIGNVILTAALVVALFLFVAAASGLATIYTLRARQTLLQGEAEQIAQLIQQVYLIVNSTQVPSNTNYVVKNLGLPNQLEGYPYVLSVSTTQSGQIVSITVTISLVGTYGSSSATAIMGKNFYLYSTSGNSVSLQGANTISAQFYKCAAQPPQGSPCTGQPAGEVVLKLKG